MVNFIKQFYLRIKIFLQLKKEINKIEKETNQAIDKSMEEVRKRCLHDVSISEDDLAQAVLDETKKVGEKFVLEAKEKIRLLVLESKKAVEEMK